MHIHTLYMAPLRGYTDHIFRTIYTDHFGGFDLAVAPFISSKSDRVMKPKYVRDLLPENNPNLAVVPQILSKSADDFSFLANHLYDLGYDTVNWNLGCPFPMVAKKKRGSGMLPYPEMIQEFLNDSISKLKGRLSIKIRLGWQNPQDIFRLLPILNSYPLQELIIHPRTGIQRYEGTVDLDTFEKCLPLIKHPVVYNGDIRTPKDFMLLSQRFRDVNRWMIGRGCLADPFLALEINTPGIHISHKIDRIKAFHNALFDAYRDLLSGPSHVMNKMKGFWGYFSHLFKDSEKAVKKIKKSTHTEVYSERVDLFFRNEALLK